MVKDKKNVVILVLSIFVVISALFLLYFLVIRPSLDNLRIQERNYGYQYAVYTLFQQAASCPSTGVPLTIYNNTINLFAIECLQQATQQTNQQTQTTQ
jgi:hypothetical protein